jgi:hypothetical protein
MCVVKRVGRERKWAVRVDDDNDIIKGNFKVPISGRTCSPALEII